MKNFLQFTLICVVMLFATGNIWAQTTINVPASYETIQAAIDAASNDDVIEVAAGTYKEFITINKPLTLKGAFSGTSGNHSSRDGSNESIICPPDDAARQNPQGVMIQLIDVTAENVTIDGFTLQDEKDLNSEYAATIGIYSDQGNFKVKNNRLISLPMYGICVHRSAGDVTASGTIIEVEISNNYIKGTAISDFPGGTWAYAISLLGTVADVLDNVVDESRVGIAVQPYNEPTIEIITDGLVNNNTFNTYTIGVFNHQGGVSGHYAVSGNWTFSNNEFNLAETLPSGIVTRTTYTAVYTRASKFYFGKSITYSNNTFDVSNVATIGYVKDKIEGFTYRNDIFHEYNQQHTADDIGFIYTSNTFTSDDFDFYFDRSSGDTYPTYPPMALDFATIKTGNTFTNGSVISGNKLLPPTKVNVVNTTQGLGYETIQAAIDAASDGDVIEVAAGTYTENVEINVPNLTLKSTNGRDETIVDNPNVGSETFGIGVLANMGTVTVDGFTANNFRNGIGQGMSQSEGTAFIVKNSKVIPENNNSSPYLRNGIQVSGNYSEIINNIVVGAPLTSNWASTAIGVVNASNVLVQGNTANTPAADIGISVLNYSADLVQTITIEDNTVIGAKNSIRISGKTADKQVKGITIEGNTLKDSPSSSGINVQKVSLENLTVSQNTITGHNQAGVRFSGTSATLSGSILINNNKLNNNGSGIINGAEYTVNATCNWWGTTDATAIGNLVSGDVQYLPFSTSADPMNCDGVGPVVVYEGATTDIRSSHMTIQAAINAAVANDVIEVAPGTYEETLDLKIAGITVKSTNGAQATTIKGSQGFVATITADNTTLDGFTIDGNDVNIEYQLRAITPTNSTGSTIKNNIIKNSFRGVQGDVGGSPQDLAVINNVFDTYYGLVGTEGSKNLTVKNNTFNSTANGIGLGSGVSLTEISGNTFNNIFCMTFYEPTTDVSNIINNTFTGGSSSGAYILDFGEQTGGLNLQTIIDNNTFAPEAIVTNAAEWRSDQSGSWPERWYIVDKSKLPVINTTRNVGHREIQAAIDAANDNDVIEVAAGTYTENVEINVPNLTLKSTNGRDETIVDNPNVGSETAGISVIANMGTVTVDGFTTDGFRSGIIQGMSQSAGTAFIVKNCKVIPENNDTDPYLRNGIQVSGTNSQVINNYIVGAPLTSTWASSGIGVVNASDVLVEGNTVNTASADIGICVYNYSNGLVNGITINNNTINGAGKGIRLCGKSGNLYNVSDVTISNNAINNGGRSGIQFYHVALSNINIEKNTIQDNLYFGIEATSTDLSGIQVEDNEFAGHWAGIYFYTGCTISGTINVTGNAIYDNSNYHFVNSATGQAVNAINNYWDACPSIYGDVDYFPYYTTISGDPGSFVFGGQITNITTSADKTICAGSSTTITAGNGSNFLWDKGLGLGTSKIVSPAETTTYTVTSDDSHGCPGGEASVTITVVDAPVVTIVGPSVVGIGENFTLTATAGYADYLWLGDGIPDGNTFETRIDRTSTFTVKVENIGGCYVKESKTVTVAGVNAGPNQFSCSGAEVELSATAFGFTPTSYTWTPGELTGASVKVYPITTTTYTVTATDGTISTTDQIKVFVYAPPTANAGDDITIATSGTLNGSASGGTAPYSYAWTGPGSFTSTDQNPTVSAGGTYTLTVTDGNGCTDTDGAVVTVVESGVSVSGNVSYAFGNINEQMHDVTLTLTETTNSTTYTTTTASTGIGNYEFVGVADGTYEVSLNSPKPWGGVNFSDLNAIIYHYYAKLYPGYGFPEIPNNIKRRAADANDDGSVNMADYSAVSARISGTALNTGDWVFMTADDYNNNTIIPYANNAGNSTDKITITVSGSAITQNFKGLCYGDVDASNTGMKENEIENPEVWVNLTEKFGLMMQSYPNPFQGSTTLNYLLPVDSKVTLEVYNLMGEKVDVIAQNMPQSYGMQQIEYSNQGLQPGVYIVLFSSTSPEGLNFRQNVKWIVTK